MHSDYHYCNDSTISTQTVLSDISGGGFNCSNGFASSFSLNYVCTDYSTNEGWTTGGMEKIITINNSTAIPAYCNAR